MALAEIWYVRCHRLQRECTPSDAIRRRTGHKGHKSGSKIAHLEGRIESLVSLLQSVTSSPDSVAALQQAAKESDRPGATEWDVENLDDSTDDPPDDLASSPLFGHNTSGLGERTQSSTYNPTPGSQRDGPCIDNLLELTDEEQQQCLNTFRAKKLSYCPFLRLPSTVSLRTLQRDRPFLLRAITAVATPSTQSRVARGRELKKILSHEVVLENRSSVDLLLALLTFVAWSYDQYLAKKGLSRLLHLAMSVAYDLRLHVPQPNDGFRLSLTRRLIWAKPDLDDAEAGWDSEDERLEKVRAVLGYFLLSSW